MMRTFSFSPCTSSYQMRPFFMRIWNTMGERRGYCIVMVMRGIREISLLLSKKTYISVCIY
jgi:hypothetical protein